MHLFRPLMLGSVRLSNRIAMTALPSGHATTDGFVGSALTAYYTERAHGGVGLIVIEPTCAVPPGRSTPHLGLYADVQVPGLRQCIALVHQHGPTAMLMLDQPLAIGRSSAGEIESLAIAWTQAAWRAHAAGADGIMLSAMPESPFGQLLSPLLNQRTDQYGGDLQRRMRLLLDVVEQVRAWMGERLLIGVRLNVGEFVPAGLPLHDARVVAKRLASAGVNLIEIDAHVSDDSSVARFPGWLVPLAARVKAMVDIPVMVGGLLADAVLANGVIRDGSADLVAIGEALRAEPRWPYYARAALADERRG